MITSFIYDQRNRLIRKIYPDNSMVQYSYRGDGNVSEQITVGDKIHTYEYNHAGELARLNINGEIERVFEYNANGDMIKITNNELETDYVTDDIGNVLAESVPHVPGRTLNRSFDSNNRLTNIRLGTDHQVVISYNGKGQLESVSDGNSTLEYAYVENSQKISSRTWYLGDNVILELENNYDEFIDLTTVKVNDSPEAVYSRNKDGQIVATTLHNGSNWSYGYDELRQLIDARRTADNSALDEMSYIYDQIGNRTESVENDVAKSYVTNLLNQYTELESSTPQLSNSPTLQLEYDLEGNMLTNNGWAYTWDTENRLTEAEKDDIRLKFSYDHAGRRIEKKVYESEVLTKHHKFVYDGYKLFAIYDSLNNNALFMSFIWQPVGLDVPLCMKYNDSTYYFVLDGGKNITGIFDETGNRIASYSYAPFGKIISATGAMATVNPFRFSGEFHDDETGLVYYNYRYYDPQIGRWLRRDPLEEQSDLNLYLFTSNDPLNKIDNLGQWWTDIHEVATRRWAKQLQYTDKAAAAIGEADEAVDGGPLGLRNDKSFLPVLGEQGYHFNRSNSGLDSRIEYWAKHFTNAMLYCNKQNQDPKRAAKELGISLHPYQDWVAHADYGITNKGGIWTTHNSMSPQKNYGTPGDYPDRMELDHEYRFIWPFYWMLWT